MSMPRSRMKIVTGITSLFLAQSIVGFASPSLVIGSLSLQLGSETAAWAAPRYTPRSRTITAPKRTVGTGSRGCEASSQNSSSATNTAALTLLVPRDHVGKTTADHPVFAWYLSQAVTAPLVFTLVDPGNPKPLLEQTIQNPTAGMMKLQIPETAPSLVSGKKYRWTVSIICNPNRYSTYITAQAWIEREAANSELTRQLKAATQDEQKATIYAEAGFWYDALAVLSPTDAVKLNPTLTRDRLALLQQVGLTDVVQQESQRLKLNQ